MAEHPRTRLVELIHQPIRFSIMAALHAADEVDFKFLRNTVEISDSLLSRYIIQLEDAGYVQVRKGHVGRRPRTWLSLTPLGRNIFEQHVAALQEIAMSGSPKD